MTQTRYDDARIQDHMSGKNVEGQQFMKTQINFNDPEKKIIANNSVMVPPQPQISNS